MKKLFQNLLDGATSIVEVSPPKAKVKQLIIRSACSLVSTGTERMLVDFGRASLLGKARQQPERVKMVLEKVRTDGILSAYESVRNKLDKPIPLGYSNVGVVTEIGLGVTEFSVGDRVVSNGCHAEMVQVPAILCARVPDNVGDEQAAFTVVASISLQGIRLANPTLGETIVVLGTGLIGLLTIQLLRAQGCRVLAIDVNDKKLAIASRFGAEICNIQTSDPVEVGMQFSGGYGVDSVIIAASTDSDEVISQAARMSRRRGRIVLVGVTGLNLNRADFYEKELTFQVSCSYGPGRYDPNYEEDGQDYPIGFVRWTEQRNFEAVLQLMAAGSIVVEPLITESYLFDDAANAYERLIKDKQCLGLILRYAEAKEIPRTVSLRRQHESESLPKSNHARIALVGLGNYATSILAPALELAGADLHTLVSNSGVSSQIKGRGFRYQSNDLDETISSPQIDLVVISTRHNSHAELVIKGLKANKHVFVEKPLCLSLDELGRIDEAYSASSKQLMVGFNRRFAPHIQSIMSLLNAVSEPAAIVMTVNAGEIPDDHWTQDKEVGGGRIIGEACHFIDLLRFLAGSTITHSSISPLASRNGDSASISLQFANGSTGTVHYLANGNKSFPKERLEVFCGGRILQLDNFRKLKGFGWPGFKKQNLFRQDKGQTACVKAFVDAIETGKPSPIPFDEIVEVSRVCIELSNQ